MSALHSTLSTRWIVVANESTAEFYVREAADSKLEKLFELHNDSARQKRGELISDRAGRTFDSFGRGRHAMADGADKRDAAAVRFANTIARHLTKAIQENEIREFALISAPRFLGQLRQAMHKTSIDDPYFTIAKDVVGQDAKRIEELIKSGTTR